MNKKQLRLGMVCAATLIYSNVALSISNPPPSLTKSPSELGLSVSFKGEHRKFFVNERNGGKGQTVNANRGAARKWETMSLINLDAGCVKHNSQVAIQSDGEYYWSAKPDGRLHVDNDDIGSKETFTLINHTNKKN